MNDIKSLPIMSYDSFIICTSPRSGSTLLCRLLRQTGIAGKPDSHFHEPSLEMWLNYYNLPLDKTKNERDMISDVFKAAIIEGKQNTDIFGLRLQRRSFDFFIEKLSQLHPNPKGETEKLKEAFGHIAFIHLTRKNKVEQAVSFVKATQSGLWHMASDGSELERLSPKKEPVYDFEAIQEEFEKLSHYDQEWNAWFEQEKIKPLRLTYEALSEAPQETLKMVLEHLELESKIADTILPDVAKLADHTNQEWIDRFIKDYKSR